MDPKTNFCPNPKKVLRRKIKNFIATTVAWASFLSIPLSSFIFTNKVGQESFMVAMLCVLLFSLGVWQYDYPSYD